MPRGVNGLTVAPAASQAEADEAFELACGVFSEYAQSPDYRTFKTLLWRSDPTYRPENLVLARSGGELVGALRIVPRVLYRGDQALQAAGISSVCVAPAHRGKGHSNALMAFALDHAAALGFDIALLFARRAADHYYTRFGFWGLSSYNKVSIRPGGTRPQRDALALIPAERRHLDVYEHAHAASYGDAFGRFERTPEYWAFVLERSARLPGLNWLTLCSGGRPVGYVVASAGTVHEMAWVGDLDVASVARAAAGAVPDASGAGAPVMEVPPGHRLFASAAESDLTLSTRECSFGGHMVRILGADRVRALLESRVARTLERLGAASCQSAVDGLNVYDSAGRCRVEIVADAGALTYAQTLRLLGASALSQPAWALDSAKPFNVSYPDQL